MIDPAQPSTRRKLAELPARAGSPATSRDDGKSVAFTRYLSANESQVWLIDVATGARRQLLPAPGERARDALRRVVFRGRPRRCTCSATALASLMS